jgi:hypothetical protein
VQTKFFERGLNCDQLFRSASMRATRLRDIGNDVDAQSRRCFRKANVFALNDKLSMHKKFRRRRSAAKLNRKTPRFNPL